MQDKAEKIALLKTYLDTRRGRGQANPITNSTVILTVAHLGHGTKDKHNKMDVRDENLKAMCQHCHLLFDIDEHVANGKATRRSYLIDAGQLEMPL